VHSYYIFICNYTSAISQWNAARVGSRECSAPRDRPRTKRKRPQRLVKGVVLATVAIPAAAVAESPSDPSVSKAPKVSFLPRVASIASGGSDPVGRVGFAPTEQHVYTAHPWPETLVSAGTTAGCIVALRLVVEMTGMPPFSPLAYGGLPSPLGRHSASQLTHPKAVFQRMPHSSAVSASNNERKRSRRFASRARGNSSGRTGAAIHNTRQPRSGYEPTV
jgi:hypothetical protein